MSTLVNRDCYTVDVSIIHGKIIEQRFSPDICKIKFNGFERWVSSSQVLLTAESAIDKAENGIQYLKQKIEELRSME